MTLPDRVDWWLEKAVAWLDARRLGTPSRLISYLTVAGIPTWLTFVDAPSRWLLLPFFLATGLAWVLQHYHVGSMARRITRRFGGATADFAGAIEDLAHAVKKAGRGRMSEDQVKILCVGLLHRIRDLAAVALGVTDVPKLRATLSVPVMDEEGNVHALRTWCYDATHSQRNYSRVELYEDGEPRIGAPSAFCAGIDGYSIIPDIGSVSGVLNPHRLAYRSIVSFSLPMVGSGGKPLAVVNLDADVERFFDDEVVFALVRPHVGPVLATLALVLTLRRKEGGYDFPV
jgi:hypothetical protein